MQRIAPRRGRRPRRPGFLLALLATLTTLLPCVSASAESLAGLEFWFAWPTSPDVTPDDAGYDLRGRLVILAPHGPVDVQVTGPGGDRVVSAMPGSPGIVQLERDVAMIPSDGVVAPVGVRLRSLSCVPFAALFRLPGSGQSVGDDVTRLLPTSLLGTTYLPVAYWGDAHFSVVATQDDTTVTITDPNCASPAPVVLQRGEAYQHGCSPELEDLDITGSVVQADKPVAVTCISSSRVIHHFFTAPGGAPGEFFFSYADVLLESPWPVDLLGRTHVHVPFRRENPDSIGDLLRVVAACPDTRADAVEDDGETWQAVLADVGSYMDLEVWNLLTMSGRLVDPGAVLESDGLVQVAAYTVGHDGAGAAGIGDPSMSLLDPVARWEARYVAWLPEGYLNSLGIVAPTRSTDAVTLDGMPLGGAWEPAGPGDRFAWMRLDDVPWGEHVLESSEPFWVQVSGYGQPGIELEYGAYSYPAIPLRSDERPSVKVTSGEPCLDVRPCPGECVTLGTSLPADAHEWSTGDVTPTVTVCPEATTAVTVTVIDAGGCELEGRRVVEVTDGPSPPAIAGPAQACEGECVTLTAVGDHDTYEWGTGEIGRSIEVCPAGPTTVSVTGTDSVSGCTAVADHLLTTYPPPVAGPATALLVDPCVRGIRLRWEPATWRPGSLGGVHHVYRREGDCAPADDASWELLASDLVGLELLDVTTTVGVAYSYLVEAEDEPAEAPCDPGLRGGPAARTCASPAALADPGDPEAPLLVSLSPHLRAAGYEQDFIGGPATAVTFSWALAPARDPATHVDAHRSDRASLLLPHERRVPGDTWRDAEPEGSLLFYRFFNVTECGTRGR